MTILKRKDGVNFAINNYREDLDIKATGIFKKELRLLSENHGKYARFYRKPFGHIEAVFSPEPGYILGEAVWYHFDKPDNLIYCEEIENNEAILVIVRHQSIYLETCLPLDSITPELATLLDDDVQFDIYVHGNVPISETPSDGKFTFEAKSIKKFTHLEAPAFPTLHVDFHEELLPIEDAIQALHLKPENTVIILVAVVVLVILAGLWEISHKEKENVAIKIVHTITYANPYQDLLETIQTPSPFLVLRLSSYYLNDLLFIPGYELRSISITNEKLVATYHSMNVNVGNFLIWARQHHYSANFGPHSAIITVPFKLPNRIVNDRWVIKADDVYAYITDNMRHQFPNNITTLDAVTVFSNYRELQLTVHLENMNTKQLRDISDYLKRLPISLVSSEITVNNSLLNGTLRFIIVGT